MHSIDPEAEMYVFGSYVRGEVTALNSLASTFTGGGGYRPFHLAPVKVLHELNNFTYGEPQPIIEDL